jgi:hypothetical protein
MRSENGILNYYRVVNNKSKLWNYVERRGRGRWEVDFYPGFLITKFNFNLVKNFISIKQKSPNIVLNYFCLILIFFLNLQKNCQFRGHFNQKLVLSFQIRSISSVRQITHHPTPKSLKFLHECTQFGRNPT